MEPENWSTREMPWSTRKRSSMLWTVLWQVRILGLLHESMLSLAETVAVPAIAQLIDTGGPCEGAQVVVQQHNAGPHIEEEYSRWIHDQFEMLGWMYEPQAPQGSITDFCALTLYLTSFTLYMYLILLMFVKYSLTVLPFQAHTQMCWTCTCFPPCHTGIVPSFSDTGIVPSFSDSLTQR